MVENIQNRSQIHKKVNYFDFLLDLKWMVQFHKDVCLFKIETRICTSAIQQIHDKQEKLRYF